MNKQIPMLPVRNAREAQTVADVGQSPVDPVAQCIAVDAACKSPADVSASRSGDRADAQTLQAILRRVPARAPLPGDE